MLRRQIGRRVFAVPAVQNIDCRVSDVFIKLRPYNYSATARSCAAGFLRVTLATLPRNHHPSSRNVFELPLISHCFLQTQERLCVCVCVCVCVCLCERERERDGWELHKPLQQLRKQILCTEFPAICIISTFLSFPSLYGNRSRIRLKPKISACFFFSEKED